MKNRTTILLIGFAILASCGSNDKVKSEGDALKPYTGHVIYVKEYVDSVQKFIFYDSLEVTVGVYGYQFTYHSDSVFDPRVDRIISRFNSANRTTYKTNSTNDTIYTYSAFSHDDDTLISSESATFIIGNKKLTIREFQPISNSSRHDGVNYFSDEYGWIETVYKNGKWSDLRISINSASFLDNKELKELYKQLRKHRMYLN